MPVDDSPLRDRGSRLNGVRILLIDGQADSQAKIKEFLEAQGASILKASSDNEAVAKLATVLGSSLQPDVIICDLSLPDEDSAELLKTVRAMEFERGIDLRQGILSIALLNYTRTSDRLRALAAGYQMSIHQPVNTTELLAAICSLLSRRPNSK